MANRPYLYAASTPTVERVAGWTSTLDYLDGRHVMPLAWWFFFRPDDVRLQEVVYLGSRWEELFLATERSAALERFEARSELLVSWIAPHLQRSDLRYVLDKVESWSEPFLVLDPFELGYDVDPHAAQIRRLLAGIDAADPSARQAAADFGWPREDDPDRFHTGVLGCAYARG